MCEVDNSDYTGTYSPEDNKLRLYFVSRLDKDLYLESKNAGFHYAPKQELHVAHWSPKAEDFLLKLAGIITDEDTSLEERAQQRAERFSLYQKNRLDDAESAYNDVKSISSNIPLGQPILVGHHSEKRARRDAQRIDNAMKRAVSMWDTSEYWESRAERVVRAVKYKEKTGVRVRRIKKLEAENRKYQRFVDDANALISFWSSDDLNHERAAYICNYKDHASYSFSLEKFPRKPPASQYEGAMSCWSALTENVISWEQCRDIRLNSLPVTCAHYSRLVNHNNNRLNYEKKMLEIQGGSDLLKPKPRAKQLPLLNYRSSEEIKTKNPQHYAIEFETFEQIEMTKAEYKKIPKDYKGGKKIDGTHRIKIALGVYAGFQRQEDESVTKYQNRRHRYYAVFLTDSKEHDKPEVSNDK